MSCFALLCEEADIRGGSDEVTATYLLPNYHVYQATLSPPSPPPLQVAFTASAIITIYVVSVPNPDQTLYRTFFVGFHFIYCLSLTLKYPTV